VQIGHGIESLVHERTGSPIH